jgi:hypothetical protein
MNHSIDLDSESARSEDSRYLKFIELLIDKSIKRLESESYKPRIQDALRAIRLKDKVFKTSEAEKFFWDEIEAIRQEELPKMYPKPEPISLESQIQSIILELKDQVENGILPVKIITDTFNQGKSKESQLSYRRIGQLLSTMGFRKAKTHASTYAILWDDSLLSKNGLPDVEEDEKQQSASPACLASPASPEVVFPAPQVRGWGPSCTSS